MVRPVINWFARNDVAANFLLVGILLAGLYAAFYKIPLEVRPLRDYRTIYVRVDYPGGTAKDVMQSVTIPTEEVLQDLDGVERIRSYVSHGNSRVWIDASKRVNLRELVEEVKSRVDSISTFPSETERPEVAIWDSAHWYEVITVAVTGNLEEAELVQAAQRVRDDLLEIDGISRVKLMGHREYEIAIEADQERLHSFQLGFGDLADAVRRSSIDLPAGAIESTSGTLTVRTRGQAYRKEQFERIPVRTVNGAEVLLGDVAEVNDGFEEGRVLAHFNGEPALMVEVVRSGKESAIEISNKVKEYVATASSRFPEGIHLYAWRDDSLSIRGRLGSLTTSLLQGSVLVFLLLGMFLRPQVAFWVVIGVPVSFAGGFLFMPYFGVTANVMSVFGFIIVLGLVVDDAIVTAENIYAKRQSGLDPLQASVTGAQEVAVPVSFGVLTTVVAFLPLLYFKEGWGDMARQIPPVVAPVLLFSLIESKLILPSHLKHLKLPSEHTNPIGRLQGKVADALRWTIERVYQPSLVYALRHRYAVICVFVASGLIMAGFCQGGRLGFVAAPTVDRQTIGAYFDYPRDIDFKKTVATTERITEAVETLKREFVDPGTGKTLITNVLAVSGQHYLGYGGFDRDEGSVMIEVTPPSRRTEPGPRNSEIAQRWTELVGPIPEARSFRIRGEQTGSGYYDSDEEDETIEIELRGPGSEAKTAMAEAIANMIDGYEGIADAWDDARSGQDELEIRLKPRAAELALTQRSLAQQVRQAFYGEEAQRVQRGVDNIRVMVRLPRRDRESLHTLEQLKIRTPRGAQVPLATVASIRFVKTPSRISRLNGAEVTRIYAQPVDETVDFIGIADEIRPRIAEMLQDSPDLSFKFAGRVEEYEDSKRRTLIGAIGLLFALYALLAIPFKSMTQPIYVLLAVPFGVVGALLGHIIMGITPSYLSVFGMLALAGVVVNDSLVLVDYINRRQAAGETLYHAVLKAGGKRFRPILLTSITTFAGLAPLMADDSIQAQFLIPMAVSLGFGILFATVITLFLIPCALLVGDDAKRVSILWREWFWEPFLRS